MADIHGRPSDVQNGTLLRELPRRWVDNGDGTYSEFTGAGGGGGGGGAVTVADGADATLGAKADAAASADTGTFSVVAVLKRIVAKLSSVVTNTGNIPAPGQALAAGSTPVVLPAAQVTTLTPPSVAALATSAKQDTGNTSLDNIDTNTALNAVGGAGNLWDAVVAAGDESSGYQINVQKRFIIHGTSSTAPNRIVLAYSVDDGATDPYTALTWYDVPNGESNFAFFGDVPAIGYLKLKSKYATTIFATLSASA